jgi:hypothetical protein
VRVDLSTDGRREISTQLMRGTTPATDHGDMTVGPAEEYGSSAAHSADDTADNTATHNDSHDTARIDNGGIRASDGEREGFAQTIMAASRDGRLNVDETDQRLARIYAATFRDELPELVKDLPREDWPAGFGGTPNAEPGQDRPTQPRQRSLPQPPVWTGALTAHVAIVSVFAVMAVLAWTRSGVPFFWPAWPIGWLGVSVLVHYRIRRRRQRWRAMGGGDWRPWGPPGWGSSGWGSSGGGPPRPSRFDLVEPWRSFRGDGDEPPIS